MSDTFILSTINKAVKVLKENKVTGDYEVRLNIAHFRELVDEIFKMMNQVIIGYYDRDIPITTLINQINHLEKQIQKDLGGK